MYNMQYITFLGKKMNLADIGNKITSSRKEMGLSQKELAQMYTELSTRTLAAIESGKGNPTLSTLIELLDVLGLELKIEPKM